MSHCVKCVNMRALLSTSGCDSWPSRAEMKVSRASDIGHETAAAAAVLAIDEAFTGSVTTHSCRASTQPGGHCFFPIDVLLSETFMSECGLENTSQYQAWDFNSVVLVLGESQRYVQY